MSQPFNMQKAREICGRIKGYEDPDGGNFADFQAAEMFPAALDEIERQANRIAELKASAKRAQTIISGNLGYIEAANRKMEKQRVALKKLGETIRARGKALVEERARFNSIIGAIPANQCKFPEQDLSKAREQLRAEGKL